ncbi:MAG: DNA polymerase III subunit gamma/tau [Methylophilaceae bacterium]|nr:DNA polymerase III subunit gamma/tau [Methylophilaceae bacterium]
MSYQVLALKWRPKSFDTLVGQESTVQALSNALDQKRLHHAYLFNGTRGVGKTTIARILAKSLNCQQGVSSNPCQECSTCHDIDTGRYADLIEVDAASNTGVDNVRELLENAQYAPSSGPYKIYIIDEVHMLSKSAFNAMLKTLEEPPNHVKFILATTEPKKVPITVLSRCLQFNLKQMTVENINSHLKSVLKEESIDFEENALLIIAKAAKGSMRDALSILDQAIAFSGTEIKVALMHKMLGSIDENILYTILERLSNNDGHALIQISKEMEEKNISFESALEDLSQLIYQISSYQIIPQQFESHTQKESIYKLSKSFSAESLQLIYQITINGKKELSMAPDIITGFNMTLLRMLAFYPSLNIDLINNKNKDETLIKVKKEKLIPKRMDNAEKKISITELDKKLDPQTEFNGDWRTLVEQLKLGLAKSLAQECELMNYHDNTFNLSLNEKYKHLNQKAYVDKLQEELINHFNKKINLEINLGDASNSPSSAKKIEKAELLKTTESAIMKDEFVNELINEFGAEIVPSSIKPTKNEEK